MRSTSFAVLDQGIFSGASLVLHLVLARILPVAEYGHFAVGMATLVFLSGLHNALLLEPMTILGPSRYGGDRLPVYLRRQAGVHLLLSIPAGLALAGVGMLLGYRSSGSLGCTLVVTGLGLPVLLLPWATRRGLYVIGRPDRAALSSLVFLASVVVGVAVAAKARAPWAWHGVLVLIVASTASAAASSIGFQSSRCRVAMPPVVALVREQAYFGRWLVLTALLNGAGTQAQVLLAAVLLGSEASGTLRAVQTPTSGLIQLLGAVTHASAPGLSAAWAQGEMVRVLRSAGRVRLTLVVATAAYVLVLLLFAGPIEEALYGGKYAAAAWLLPIVGLSSVFVAASTRWSLVLRASHVTSHHLAATGGGAAVSCILTLVLAPVIGVAGPASAVAGGSVATAVILFVIYRAQRVARGSIEAAHA